MSKKMMSLSEEQLFLAAATYEASHCELPLDDFLLNLSERYSEMKKTYKTLRPSTVKVGKKSDLNL